MEVSSDREDDHVSSDHEEDILESEGSDEESGSESDDDPEGASAFLDLEASESGSDDDDAESDDGSVDDAGPFHPFTRLPPELRLRVWEFFDTDLRTPARVFSFLVMGGNLVPMPATDQQTWAARAMLGTHRESRQLALKFYPDALPISGDSGAKGDVCPFNAKRDVVLLIWMSAFDRNVMDWEPHVSALKDVQHLAFGGISDRELYSLGGTVLGPSSPLPSVEAVYLCGGATRLRPHELRWCLGDQVRTFEVVAEEPADFGLNVYRHRQLYCWPDLENHRDFALEVAATCTHPAEENHGDPPTFGPARPDSGRPGLWPMLLFDTETSALRYLALRTRSEAEPDAEWDSDITDEIASPVGRGDWSTPDDYESEGIDDDTIDEDGSDGSDGSDESDVYEGDDLSVDGVGVHGDDDDDEEDGPGFEGFSPLQSDGVEGATAARFSSLEAESRDGASQAGDANADSDAESDDAPTAPAKRRGARRRVVDSDSEDGDGSVNGEAAEPPQRQASRRRARVVLSDSDDSDGSDGEDSDGGAGVGRPGRSRAPAAESDEEESDEEEPPDDKSKKPLSLAERLRLFRSANPVSSGDEDEDDDDEDGGRNRNRNYDDDDEDGGGGFYYGNAEDDDDDDEGDLVNGGGSLGDEISENDLHMNMAEEHESDGGEEW